jgi:hypothetical protein
MIQTRGLTRISAALIVAAAGVVGGMTAAYGNPFGAQSDLTAVSGQGAGKIIVSPTAADGHGAFDARVTVNIRQTTPNTDFTVTRTADPIPDGICTGTIFGTVATLQTSAGGAGAVAFERTGPLLQFDLLVRVVGGDGTILQSDCMTITAK